MDWTPLRDIIENNSSFLITTHVRPDADALGSELGMQAILEAFGKSVHIINASAPPANLQFLTPEQRVRKLNTDIQRSDIPAVDVVIVVDTSAWQQLGSMADVIAQMPAQRVVIDHHVSSDDLHALEFKDIGAAATGELIFELAEFMGVEIGDDVANALYAAIATDTGWFRFPSTTARTMRIGAALMDRGASPHLIYNLVNEQSSLARIRLSGRVLDRIRTEADDRLVWVYADSADLKETGAVPADTEGLVNQCLTVAGSEAAFIAVELQTGAIKFSLRCRPPHNVAAVAEQFGGGGHRLASGASLPGPMPQAVLQMRQAFLQMLGPSESGAAEVAPDHPDASAGAASLPQNQ
ncbi:MAG: bifunctional oligoribonuclease/PAP phosphatase NrnA [Planctomycetaceae bacterium]|nr:bifunctional oligoribonuclease/PAP phosphatase NrnA [Planctomycetaceae bacterium]